MLGAATLSLGSAFLLPFGAEMDQAQVTMVIAAPLLLSIMVIFGSLTTAIADGHLRWSFGPGILRKSVLVGRVDALHNLRKRQPIRGRRQFGGRFSPPQLHGEILTLPPAQPATKSQGRSLDETRNTATSLEVIRLAPLGLLPRTT